MLQSLRGIIFQVDLLNPATLFWAVLLDLVMTQSLLETLIVEGLMLIGSCGCCWSLQDYENYHKVRIDVLPSFTMTI
jgi:hypothetical protein